MVGIIIIKMYPIEAFTWVGKTIRIYLKLIDHLFIKTRMSGQNVHITLFRRTITYLDFLLLRVNYS